MEGQQADSAMRSRPRVFTIPPSVPFLRELAIRLRDGELVPGFKWDPNDPLAFADATILVPTRRAARSLREIFLDELGGRAAILPKIRPLGDVDEDGLTLEAAGDEPDPSFGPAIAPLERRLAMTRLVLGWKRTLAESLKNPVTGLAPTLPSTPAEAAHLATALLTLMDQVETEGADWSALKTLVPEDYADFWQITLAFLSIVTEHWPAYLAERGLEDPARRRNAVMRREAERLRRTAPTAPVIAAGSTGSIPAAAELIEVVSRLPNGVVVLPGLDLDLDDAAWNAIGSAGENVHDNIFGHPQYGLKLMLERLRVPRNAVEALGTETPAGKARGKLLSEALRPAPTTDTWPAFAAAIADGSFAMDAALDGFSLIEAASDGEEALAVALALREAIEDPNASAALISPDRALARRVSAELARWGIAVDDSAGTPLGLTPPVRLARLVAEVALGGFEPLSVAALLSHPQALFGLPPKEARRAARALELAVLRGPRPAAGSKGLRDAFEAAWERSQERGYRTSRPRRRLGTWGWERARDLLDRLCAALAPLERVALNGLDMAFVDLVKVHLTATRAVGTDADGSDAGLFEGEMGEALATAFASVLEAAAAPDLGLSLKPIHYSGLFDALIGDVPVRRPTPPGARLHIWGPLEARLQSVDLVVLAGLDEGLWPQTTRSDPWLSRPMKHKILIDPPERRIGLSAHDFVLGAAACKVMLSRAQKRGGTPTVASRWVQRLKTVIGEPGVEQMRAVSEKYLAWARLIDRPAVVMPATRPEPRPPVERRPTGLSVTRIETWIRDPYAIYAEAVLGLDEVDPIGGELEAADWGNFVHNILATFVADWNGRASPEARRRLIALAEERLVDFEAFPEVVALWRPKFARIADFVLQHEAARTPLLAGREVEIRGEWRFPSGRPEPFLLTGRADRIDRMADGTIAIVDYKTGAPPSKKQVRAVLAPQLPLEAAMVRLGGFGEPLKGKPISELAYVKLGGRGGGLWESRADPADKDGKTPEVLADEALRKLHGLIAAYARPEQAYVSRPRIQFESRRDGPYDHLARVDEWAAGEGGEE